jgi:branched-chain amino acid transport system ATP-binding protein
LARFSLSAEPLLSLTKISAGYGSKCILEDVTLKVCSGEAIALIGHNGAGKTTALQTIFGLQAPWSGKINFDGHPLGSTHSAAEAVSLGMSMVPAERFVFAETVSENLQLGARALPASEREARLKSAFEEFPILFERQRQLAGTMSGGQQRMVSLAMALMARPRLLLLDEPSLGLSPAVTQQIMTRVRALVDTGMSVILVEQNIPAALSVADRVYVLRSGMVLLEESAADMRARGRENWWKLF